MKKFWYPKGIFLLFLFMLITFSFMSTYLSPDRVSYPPKEHDVLVLSTETITFNESRIWKRTCQFHTCFEINDCPFNLKDRISVHVYPEYDYYISSTGKIIHKTEMSQEYKEVLDAVRSSEYYEPVPSEACVFIPSIDTLNQRRLNLTLTSIMLQALPWWNNGQNHLLFSMLPGDHPTYNSTPDVTYGQAILAGSNLDINSYRKDYDISIPVFNSLTRTVYTAEELNKERSLLLTVLCQLGTEAHLFQHFLLTDSSTYKVVLLGSCEHCPQCHVNNRCVLNAGTSVWKYPKVLKESIYCLVLPGYRIDSPDFLDIMMSGCIPVVLHDSQQMLPFSEVLDWNRAVVYVWKEELPQLISILQRIPTRVRKQKKLQVQYLYNKYFQSMKSITMTALDLLNSRVFSLATQSYEAWNNRPFDATVTEYFQHSYPLPVDLPPSQPTEGFTAVILTYNRIQLLFQTIVSVSQAPSLAMVLVVWNNVDVDPPRDEEWPLINKQFKIIRSKDNRLSNRFLPYQEIKTSAVLSLDDDITMLTTSEIEFGYKVWLEYPKQIVGYPGRVHWFDKHKGKWMYESEWMNNISVVLTGAAFYHKHYHYMYTYKLPSPVKLWVDDHSNCEDILFNFMVSNYTGLPPIKVTPRKRFTCVNCTKEGLFTDVNHFNERNECINLLSTANFFNGVPLKTVKFRLDPVLFKVSDVGTSLDFPEVGLL